jgi:hypothetical protein
LHLPSLQMPWRARPQLPQVNREFAMGGEDGRMLNPQDITDAGFYWYLDAIDAPALLVEVVRHTDDMLVARFTGRDDEDALPDLSGTFIGPLRAPSGRPNTSMWAAPI